MFVNNRKFLEWRLCQQWHFQPKYAALVHKNTKNPIPALARARAFLEAQKRLKDGESSSTTTLDLTVSELSETNESQQIQDISDTVPNRLTRGSKRAIAVLVNENKPEDITDTDNKKRVKRGPKPKLLEPLRITNRPKRQYTRRPNSNTYHLLIYLLF